MSAALSSTSATTPPSLDLTELFLGENDEDSFSDDELIPVRMLNEFAYCPRLAYLEWIQGEFTDNLDTKQGTFGHRNVDQSSTRHVPAASRTTELADTPNQSEQTALSAKKPQEIPDNPATSAQIKTRSLTLSARREGLIAKLDLLELDGIDATPVEYKKGPIPDNRERAWEPERVQLCAQGLILRENGFQSDQGELYYIESRHRVPVPFDEPLIMRTRELVRGLRELSRSRTLPPPLVDSPKCPRCSIVGICLPDETNALMHSSTSPTDESKDVLPSTPRRLLPARDDASPIYVKEQGAYIGKDGDRLVVRCKDQKLASTPLIEVSQVSLFGNVQISSQALREVVDRDIPVCYFNYGGWFQAMTVGHSHKNVNLRLAQYGVASDPDRSLAIAKELIAAKIRNCRTLLRRHFRARDNTDEPASVIDHNTEIDKQSEGDPSTPAVTAKPDSRIGDFVLGQLAEWIQKTERAMTAETLLGLEGMAAKTYFAGYAKLLKGGSVFDLTGRNRRPPRDPVNAILSFVYALLAKELTIAVRAVGFDPMLGFFHKPRYGRPSLALDLAEEFRPLIADSTTLMLINNGEVNESSFLSRAGAVALTESGRKAVIAAFERRLEQEITHPIFGYKISYRRVIEVQARLLTRVILGELPKYPGFCTR